MTRNYSDYYVKKLPKIIKTFYPVFNIQYNK